MEAKTKYKWIKEGDRYTTFFHGVANGRKWKNLINKPVIKSNEVSNFEEIETTTSNYYERLFSRETTHHHRIVNHYHRIVNLFDASLSPEWLSLEESFIEEEIKVAIFSADKEKSLV